MFNTDLGSYLATMKRLVSTPMESDLLDQLTKVHQRIYDATDYIYKHDLADEEHTRKILDILTGD